MSDQHNSNNHFNFYIKYVYRKERKIKVMSEKNSFEMSKHYNPQQVEDKWYAKWEQSECFRSQVDVDKKPYTIVIPPPNVTGKLHMGHALNDTLQDILIRAKRMQGDNALWQPGTDHAGIATQNVVERELKKEGMHRDDLGRDKFIERVWKWKEEYGASIISQLKKLGCSCDWSRERFTMDEGLSKAVRTVFVRLYKEGLIYKGRRLINWCPKDHTALADDEVEHAEKEGKLWHIKYPIKDNSKFLTVATTRPETMLGDTAIAVHPDDERYTDLIGTMVILPIVGREIPIVADSFVDPKFGTGCVKVTPAHDPNDYECGLRNNLEQIIVIGPDGTMTEAAGKYQGLERFRCREKLVEELEEKKFIEKIEEHIHSVGHCYRCDTVIEPYLSEQWFVKMKPLAEKAIAASEAGKIHFHPQRWENVYLSWLTDVRDWCISRQIWWGHRIPVWYCEDCGEIIVEETDPTCCPKCNSENIQQEDDVLDTWFSSALWPFSTLGWPDDTEDLKYYYPTNTLSTDRGIIYFWVARMVMMGLHFMKNVPFSDVYIHGTILDENGAKMSKSKGNGIDPIVMIEGGTQQRMGKEFKCDGYGADAVRYTLASLTTEGQDIKLNPTRFENGRNFINKVWNASRFVMMNLSELELDTSKIDFSELEFEDRWILSRLNQVIEDTTAAVENFRFIDITKSIYDFTWRDYCDWYVEMVKTRLRSGGRTALIAGRVLSWVLDNVLRLLHPIAPFFTEEVWAELGKITPQRGLDADPAKAGEFLMLESWPAAIEELRNIEIENSMNRVQNVVRAIRNIRAKFNIPHNDKVPAVISAANEEFVVSVESCIEQICLQAVAENIELGVNLEKPNLAAAEVLDGAQVFVPLSGFMDVELEKKRVSKDLVVKEKSLNALKAKLHNEGFIAKAPEEVVEREKARKVELTRQIQELKELAMSLESEN